MITQRVKDRLMTLAGRSTAGSNVLAYQMDAREREDVSTQRVLWVLRQDAALVLELGGGAEHVRCRDDDGEARYEIHDSFGISTHPRREMVVLLEDEPFRVIHHDESLFATGDVDEVAATNRGESA